MNYDTRDQPLPISNEQFISLVEERPTLWDKFYKQYKNRTSTQNAWREIFLIIYPEFNTWSEIRKRECTSRVIKKWTYLRDSFIKSEKRIQFQKQSGRCKPVKRYIYHKELAFLKKVSIVKRKPEIPIEPVPEYETIAYPNPEEYVEAKFEQSNDFIMQMNDNDTPADLQLIEQTQSAPSLNQSPQNKIKSKRKKQKKATRNAAMLKVINSLTSPPDPINRHISFFNGIIPTLDKFNDDQTLEFQLGVLKLVKAIKNNSNS